MLVAVIVLGGLLLLYGAGPEPRIVFAASSATIALIVIAHLAVFAAVIALFAIRRRRARGRRA